MNEDIRSNEISDAALEDVSGGVANECNRGHSCPLCGSDNIRVFDQNGLLSYFCFSCRRGGQLNS